MTEFRDLDTVMGLQVGRKNMLVAQKKVQTSNFLMRVGNRATNEHGPWVDRRIATPLAPKEALAPLPPPFPQPKFTLSQSPPYAIGNPSPERTVQTPGSLGGVTIEAFGDETTGQISLAVAGGNFPGGGFGATPPNIEPMPDRWLGGDAITSNASISQEFAIPNKVSPGSHFFVDVDFGWTSDPNHKDPAVLEESRYYVPGSSEAYLNGFVGMSVDFHLNVFVLSANKLRSSSTTSRNVLSRGVDNDFYGYQNDRVAKPFVFNDWAFQGDVTRTVSLATVVHNAKLVTRVVVEASVSLIGFRGGVADEKGGCIVAAFSAPGAKRLAGYSLMNSAFLVKKISIHSY